MASPQLAQVLAQTLNADPNARITAELVLADALNDPQNALVLAQLVLADDLELSLRQSASIVLRKYVREHWSPLFPAFRGNAPPPELKAHIRGAMFAALSLPARKLRALAAHTLSTVARADWPDEYPSLLGDLIGLLESGARESIHGAMGVLADFVREELTEDQLLPVLRTLLPALLAVLSAPQTHGAHTRARTVAVFRAGVEALYMVRAAHPAAVADAAEAVLPPWLAALSAVLSADPAADVATDDWDALALRAEALRTLLALHTAFPKALAPHLPSLLSAALAHLPALHPAFVDAYIADTRAPRTSAEDEPPTELPALAGPLLDFLSACTRARAARPWFVQHGGELVKQAAAWALMTKDNEEEWAGDANAFVANEDDEGAAYGVRAAVFDLISSLLATDPASTARALSETLESAVGAWRAQAPDAWRGLEAALAVAGAQAEGVLDALDDESAAGRPAPIDLSALLSSVVPALVGLSEHPFLQGRALVFAAAYARALPNEATGQYLEAAVQVLESGETGVPFKISAVKAIQQFCGALETEALEPFAPRMAKDLGPFLLQTTEDTLSLVLETLRGVVEVADGRWLDVALGRDIVLALLEVWAKNIKDPIFLSILTDLFATLAGASPDVYSAAAAAALPRLTDALAHPDAAQPWIASSALELLAALARGAPEASGLGPGFVATVAPATFTALAASEDRDVLQAGVALLTLLVRRDVAALLAWRDAEGCSGLGHAVLLVRRLVGGADEAGGLAVGELVVHLLRAAGADVLPVLPDLLSAMLARMRAAQTATFLQSLLVPFAFLLHAQRDALLDTLDGARVAPDGAAGTEVFLNAWAENAGTFQGFWAQRVSALALCDVLAARRPSVRATRVKGEIVHTDASRNKIMTRSRTRAEPPAWTQVPFPVKALKLLVHELLAGDGEAAAMNVANVPDDDEGSDWEEDGDGPLRKDEMAFLADMLGPKGARFADEDGDGLEIDDEELRNDPIAQVDIQAHVVGFLKDFMAGDAAGFAELVGQLTDDERAVVQQAVAQ